jgi:hypothetical protein
VPVDLHNREAYVYTNTVVGVGHDAVCSLAIVVSSFVNSRTRIDVYGVPDNASSLTLYRRDCTQHVDELFQVIDRIEQVAKGTSNFSFTDRTSQVGRVYEYYCVVGVKKGNHEVTIPSNYVLFQNIPYSADNSKAVNVTTTSPFNAIDSGGNRFCNFQINISVPSSEKQSITDFLKEQLGELYEQYLNPANNPSSPLGDDGGIPEYADLFFHEVVRTNLNTSEREVFALVSSGAFSDNTTTQKKSNIKPINPLHDYIYSVFTYRKNPVELFKNFIARGTDSHGVEWFYSPYKWRNSSAKAGYLYADDPSTNIPSISAYENFRSECYGLTASVMSTGSKKYSELTQVVANRINKSIVKISWSVPDNNIYDAFVVMKVVNGVRSLVGRSRKNFIYHSITPQDIGTVYYIVVPISSNFVIDSPGYTSSILILPDMITPRTVALPNNTNVL